MFKNAFFLSLGTLAAMSCSVLAQAQEGDGNVQDQASLIRQEIQQMETRIAELEQKPKATPATRPSTQPSAPRTIPSHTHVASSSSTSSSDAKGGIMPADAVIPEGFKFESVTSGLTFNGYFRAGYGVNGSGDSMEAFKAKGAQSKYRLGNETEAYIETAFGYNFPELDLPSGTEFSIHFRPAYVINNSAESALTDLTVREAYGSAKGVWAAHPEASFWAGQRFYSRMDVHMTDFYYMDMSGYGGGIEDIDLGFGKFSAAWLGGNVDMLNSNASEELDATNNKDTIDFRLRAYRFLEVKVLCGFPCPIPTTP